MAMPVVASRFSMLPDDDEDLNKKKLLRQAQNKSQTKNEGHSVKSKEENFGETKKKPNKKKNKKKNNNDKELQALAFGKKVRTTSEGQECTTKSSDTNNDEQFAHWVSHDQMANDEAFAKDLQAAIMASKIDMMRDGTKTKDESKNFGGGGDLKKSKKPMAMSLQAFNNMNLNGEVPGDHCNDPNVKDNFFEDVDEASKLALNREQIRESLQQRYSILPDEALVKQYKSILEEKDEKITNLMLENQAMSLELQKIKKRYKQFRELLEQVESRDKAEIVSENLKLKKVQTEISSELETLREENEKLKTRLGEKDRDLLKLKDRRKNSESGRQ